jgi:hypothetical protein
MNENLPGIQDIGFSQMEIDSVESKRGSLMYIDGQWNFSSKIWECFTVDESFFWWGS